MTPRAGLLRPLPPARQLVVLAVVVVVITTVMAALATVRARASAQALCERHQVDAAERARGTTGRGHSTVVIGDSWSVGLGLRDLHESWPARLPGRVDVAGFSGSGFSRGASHCGDRSFATRVPAARGADLVVVAGGLNDHDQSAADIRAGLRSLVRGLDRRELVVVGPAAAPARAARVGRVGTVLEQLCAELDVPYVDASGIRLDYLHDRLHLTAAGHDAFGDFVAAELTSRGLLH